MLRFRMNSEDIFVITDEGNIIFSGDYIEENLGPVPTGNLRISTGGEDLLGTISIEQTTDVGIEQTTDVGFKRRLIPNQSTFPTKGLQIKDPSRFVVAELCSDGNFYLKGTGPKPLAPNDLVATAISYNQIDLSWIDYSTHEVGFIIKRKRGAAGKYSEIGKAGINATTYTDKTVGPNTEYFYKVCAYNDHGKSSDSNEQKARTRTPEEIPEDMSSRDFELIRLFEYLDFKLEWEVWKVWKWSIPKRLPRYYEKWKSMDLYAKYVCPTDAPQELFPAFEDCATNAAKKTTKYEMTSAIESLEKLPIAFNDEYESCLDSWSDELRSQIIYLHSFFLKDKDLEGWRRIDYVEWLLNKGKDLLNKNLNDLGL